MQVDVSTQVTDLRGISTEQVALWARAVLEALEVPDEVELSILLADDEAVHDLNRAWRGVDRPTDVLAFPMREGDGPSGPLLGDVVLSIDTVARQAVEQGHSFRAEFLFLLIHGILHLLGYDHRTGEEAAAMDALTRRIWHQLL